jgi:hypothetical protein
VPPSLYETCTFERALAAFGDPAGARFFCDRQFAVFPHATLCFATMGDPETGTRLLGPSKLSWTPARLDFHPRSDPPWVPGRLARCVERNGAWLPLHHLFLRAAGDEAYVFAGIAEVPLFGDIPEGGRVRQVVHFALDAKLPRELWLHLGGYEGRLVTVNGVEHRFAAADAEGLERLLADVPGGPKSLAVWIAGYEEHWFTAHFNARRAWLRFVPGGERRVRAQGMRCTALESWDPGCPAPQRREFFGNDGQVDVVFPAGRTVPREAGVRAAVEHLRTGQVPGCVRWRLARLWG